MDLLRRTADTVATRLPGGARLSIGELSAQKGGHLIGHRSHRSGRDADVGFYLLDENGAPVEADHFVRVWRSGHAHYHDQLVHFDEARNWALISTLLTDTRTPVKLVIVAATIKRRLLREGQREGASADVLDRVGRALLAPTRGRTSPHRDHFHVRIYCDPTDATEGCIDKPPFWPWVLGHVHVPQRYSWALVTPTSRPH